jgi:hypothetical protein
MEDSPHDTPDPLDFLLLVRVLGRLDWNVAEAARLSPERDIAGDIAKSHAAVVRLTDFAHALQRRAAGI